MLPLTNRGNGGRARRRNTVDGAIRRGRNACGGTIAAAAVPPFATGATTLAAAETAGNTCGKTVGWRDIRAPLLSISRGEDEEAG